MGNKIFAERFERCISKCLKIPIIYTICRHGNISVIQMCNYLFGACKLDQ